MLWNISRIEIDRGRSVFHTGRVFIRVQTGFTQRRGRAPHDGVMNSRSLWLTGLGGGW